jgi:hypothetical protein
MRDLIEAKCRQVELIVDLEDIFEGGQSVYYVPVIHLRMLIDLHPCGAATHFNIKNYVCQLFINYLFFIDLMYFI